MIPQSSHFFLSLLLIFFYLLVQPISNREQAPKVQVSTKYTMYRYETGDFSCHRTGRVRNLQQEPWKKKRGTLSLQSWGVGRSLRESRSGEDGLESPFAIPSDADDHNVSNSLLPPLPIFIIRHGTYNTSLSEQEGVDRARKKRRQFPFA